MAGWTHNPETAEEETLPVKRDSRYMTPVPLLECLLDTQSRFLAGPKTPSPSKENETPGTGDLEGQ
jgi:hypothetical protein